MDKSAPGPNDMLIRVGKRMGQLEYEDLFRTYPRALTPAEVLAAALGLDVRTVEKELDRISSKEYRRLRKIAEKM